MLMLGILVSFSLVGSHVVDDTADDAGSSNDFWIGHGPVDGIAGRAYGDEGKASYVHAAAARN